MIYSGAVDHTTACLEVRERFAFSSSRAREAVERLKGSHPELDGCVLLSTCNRTELYVSSERKADTSALLCELAGLSTDAYQGAMVCRGQEASIRHLMEVAAGLHSQVLGEDQILAQVKAAIAIARASQSANPPLETLFRLAVTASKKIKTTVRLTALSGSAAAQAVRLLEEKQGALDGKQVLIIGNGEMGRLTARLLIQKGCGVTVTLRGYKRGAAIVPEGCGAVPYGDRYAAAEACDILVSATASPHYTVTAEGLALCGKLPPLMVDLAVPRDIEPSIGERYRATVLNIDGLGGSAGPDPEKLGKAEELIDEAVRRFNDWESYRRLMPILGDIREREVIPVK